MEIFNFHQIFKIFSLKPAERPESIIFTEKFKYGIDLKNNYRINTYNKI